MDMEFRKKGQKADKYVCEKCGMKIYAFDESKEEMSLHEAECTGDSTPKEKFDKGDRVEFSDFAVSRLDLSNSNREGEVVGFGRKQKNTVRVKWDGNKSVNSYDLHFIRHVED